MNSLPSSREAEGIRDQAVLEQSVLEHSATRWHQRKDLPPMLTQYLEYKRQYSDCHLFFQVGDFYELFFDDAVTVSRVLNLTLTTRDKNDPDPIPMCGVPIAVIDNYIDRLVARGFSVALVSQVEGPLPAKGMVQRKLERIITPGVRICSSNVDPAVEAIVAAGIVVSDSDCALAFGDAQTGKIFVRDGLSLAAFGAELQRAQATELIVPRSIAGRPVDRRLPWVREIERLLPAQGLKFRPESYFDAQTTGGRSFAVLPGYSALGSTAKKAVRLLLGYIDETTIGSQIVVQEISLKSYENALLLDASTRTNLELVKNARDGSTSGTLLEHLDRTITSGAQRLLRHWILHPLVRVDFIEARQNALAALMDHHAARERLQTLLRRVTDAERVAARLELDISSPKELAALRDTLEVATELAEVLSTFEPKSAAMLGSLAQALRHDCPALADLQSALADNPPLSSADPGIMREGFSSELDHLRAIKATGAAWMLELEAAERIRTGIGSLKIKFNNVLGFFIEITRANAAKTPPEYIRRQSTVNAERFTLPTLLEREREVSTADAKILELERKLFTELKARIRPFSPIFRAVATAVAQLDVLSALAEVSSREGYVRPVVDCSDELVITEGRHPVLASKLLGSFIPNSLEISARKQSCLVITGPNMGGKSTYIRQAGLIVIMAQLGCYVPARAARIGVVDRMFARIGASDNLAEGESTFMVEMREAAYILSAASERSLLLIDEIGRGTATSDGLAIAQAILEWIVLKLRSRALFATHFHELTGLESVYPEISNRSVGSVDRDGEVVFTHVIGPGPASRSYGIEVAKLAGLPAPLISRSRELLLGIEKETDTRKVRSSQLALFERPAAQPTAEPEDYQELKGLRSEIERIDINDLSPLEALLRLHSLQAGLKGGKRPD